MKKFSAVAALSGLLLALFSAPTAHADTVGTGDCTTTVTSPVGVVAVTSGSTCYIAFTGTGSNSFTVPSGITSVGLLIIAGGGAGGSYAFAGGGGAGEVAVASSYSVSSLTPVSISVGTGGTSGGRTAGSSSTSGTNSWVGSATGTVANGGGAGASHNINNSTGVNGGSGGGAGERANAGVAGTSVKSTFGTATRYGNAGGATAAAQAGGGGGGAGGVGGSVSTFGYPGAGGSGTNAVSSWLSAIRSGMSGVSGWSAATSTGYIAGGGGGGSNSTAVGAGGVGGGGAGGPQAVCPNNAPAGIANTGSGGGGANYECGGGLGGAGGSGLIVLRFSAPLSFPSSDTFNVAENSTTVGTITTNDSATISIFGGEDQAKFAITRLTDSSTSLSFTSAPDFEVPTDVGSNNTYIVVFRAIDSLASSAYETVTVTVTNVNEAPVITINSSAATHSLSVDEGTSVAITYSASDVDTGTSLAWSISGVDASKYSINSSSGVLALLATPDFEMPTDNGSNNTYIVVITVSDGALTDTQTLTLTINDINEPSYISAPTLSGTAYKGEAVTITVTTNTPGKVRFFAAGKRIGNCLARSTTGSYPTFTATCAWKPTNHGSRQVSAQLTPTSSTFSSATSVKTTVAVVRKTSTR